MKRPMYFPQEKHEKGQILIIVAFIFIGLMAIVGLVIDTGYMYVNYARICRAVDAAALGATNQFKEGYKIEELRGAARQFLKMNDIPLDNVADPVKVLIETCDTTPGDESLCKKPRAKLVKVTVTQNSPLYFLSILGFTSIPLTCTATSEAASLDVVMTIDTSESMANPLRTDHNDPKACNEQDPYGSDGFPGECHPFEEVKAAAYAFVDKAMYAPYDRVAIVTFDKRAALRLRLGEVPHIADPTPEEMKTAVLDTIKNLQIFEGYPGGCPWNVDVNLPPENTPILGIGEPCRLYDTPGGTFKYMDCPEMHWRMATGDPSRCPSTNIGGGLLLAGNEFAGHTDAPVTVTREEALWVVILLTDGAANAGTDQYGSPICPNYTWDRTPYCRDKNASPGTGRHPNSVPSLYDAEDYALDMADFVAKDDTGTVKGQNALIFTIGLGGLVTDPDSNGLPVGETFLQYAAKSANIDNQGEYYYAPSGNQLQAIFIAIANKIATRLTK